MRDLPPHDQVSMTDGARQPGNDLRPEESHEHPEESRGARGPTSGLKPDTTRGVMGPRGAFCVELSFT